MTDTVLTLRVKRGSGETNVGTESPRDHRDGRWEVRGFGNSLTWGKPNEAGSSKQDLLEAAIRHLDAMCQKVWCPRQG